MRIPKKLEDKEAFYRDLMEECLVSRNDRIAEYERLRLYYLWGCNTDSQPAIFNKILPQIDLLTSFLFAAETTQFSVVVGEFADKEKELSKVVPLSQRLNNRWHDSNADIQFGQAVIWSLVYGSMFVKLVQQKKQTVPYVVEPHNFGVLNEGMPLLDDQEAFVHVYSESHRSLSRKLKDHPRMESIIKLVTPSIRNDTHEVPAGVQRIVMSAFPMTDVNGPGQVNNALNSMNQYRAKTMDESIEMKELWVWDDEVNDYRIATLASGGIFIYDRPNFYLPGDNPFIPVIPNPSYDYFWGHSEVARLIQLQDARETRMQQIKELLDRQVKPPTALQGNWTGITDEMQYALQVFGAGLSSSDPTAKIEQFRPTVPTDTFAEIKEYDAMFNEMMGLSNVVQGKGESGVRSKGQTDTLARLGSARIKHRAYILEDGLDKIGTHYLKLMQQHDPEPMMDDNGHKFIAEQFTKDFTVKVDGHSSSPIFTEDKHQLMFEYFKVHAIDRATLIEGTDAPGKQVLLQRLKKIEENEAKAKKAEQEAEAKKESAKHLKLA